jgi:hypothetical protein
MRCKEAKMTRQRAHYSAEETARRGDDIYEQSVRSQVEASHQGQVVAIDIDSGAYAVAETALAAARLLSAKHPDAEVWFVRIGHPELRRIGAWARSETP